MASTINTYLLDNMELMKDKPDGYYQLAIVDPPYAKNGEMRGGGIGKDTTILVCLTRSQTSPHPLNIGWNYSVSHRIKLYGVETTFRLACVIASAFGISNSQTGFRSQAWNLRGLRFRNAILSSFVNLRKADRVNVSTRHRSPLSFTSGCSGTLRKMATESSTRTAEAFPPLSPAMTMVLTSTFAKSTRSIMTRARRGSKSTFNSTKNNLNLTLTLNPNPQGNQ